MLVTNLIFFVVYNCKNRNALFVFFDSNRNVVFVNRDNMASSEKKENFEQAAGILKKTIPLMVKNHIPARPDHYSVWYSFVAKNNLDLLRELDETLSTVGSCSEVKSETLYKKYIASESERKLDALKKAIEVMVAEFSSNIDDTVRGTDVFQMKLQNSFGKLSGVETGEITIEETLSLLREVVKNSKEIAKTVDVFSLQLRKADTEISKLKMQLNEIQKDASTDGLTNLMNRRSFDLEIAHLVMMEHPFSLIIGDIDHFKSLNDTYGHLTGDVALKAVAGVFNTSCREGFSAYRFGGEEFTMLLPDTTLPIARQIADSMRRRVEKISVMSKTTGIKINNISASFGVAEFIKGESEKELIDRADKFLYEAKRLGRNRVMPMTL